jgi:hypothetical protein
MARASAYQMLAAARLPLHPTTQVGIRREALMWAAVQPKIDLHRKPGVLHRPMRLAGTSKLDLAADGVQRSVTADAECPVPILLDVVVAFAVLRIASQTRHTSNLNYEGWRNDEPQKAGATSL